MKRSLVAIFLILISARSALAQERIKFPVGVSSKVLGYGHLWAAWRRGYFEREGLDAEVVLMRGTAPAVRGLDYYLTNQAWHPELEIELDGLKTVVDIYAEQTGLKGPIPNPEKYVDQSYLRQALKELGLR